MGKVIKRFSALAALMVGLGVASSAHAVWTFNSATTASNDTPTAPNVKNVTGAYAANNGSNVVTGSWTVNAASNLTLFPGLGMCSDGCAAPNHAIDNAGNTEAVLVGFTSSVVLSSIGLNYTTNAAGTTGWVDLSVFRYIGSGDPTLNGTSATSMTNWELVGNYGDMKVDTTSPFNLVNSTGKGSSWWLISAYNSGFTGAGETRSTVDNGNDFFKLTALAGTACTSTVPGVCGGTTTVPEPGSLGLAGLALLGVFASRRKASRAA